jgi:hypothetical protein
MLGGSVPRSIDEPYLDLRDTTANEPVVARTPVTSAAAVPVTNAVPAGVPVTGNSRMVPVGANLSSSEEATGPYFYEHQ